MQQQDRINTSRTVLSFINEETEAQSSCSILVVPHI